MAEINLFRNEPDKVELESGEALFNAGDRADHFYGLIDGEIELTIDGNVVETVGSGGVFGEVGLLGDRVRNATARANLPSLVARLDEAAFLRLVKLNPIFALEVMRVMAERLERAGKAANPT